ncbi:MAG: Rne/Rng family ribonuclease [Dethiobacter sp.]|nr:Rne/Rng family ribonuclease [Dethiobacter sp.]MBS3899565.1 Rne/Rng family ribonuclease [Dethiobacter sp.]MBS3982953.1 Rne/Rng family ribonuclease [Dethiobacter sp.]MCL4463068.1 Rne/Rng family ribonuclease [Bacillota bacterium]MCL5994321.1 Rne/Rng family ribonuclease [Bacillota bacterium]
MQKKIVINCDNRQTRVAVLEEGKPVEIYLERPMHQRVVGNIYKGVVSNVLPGMQAAFVDIGLERNAFLYVDDALLPDENNGRHQLKKKIEQLLRPGDVLMVQVIKEPFGSKGARLTRQITFPGRHLVLMPAAEYAGVSRRIEEPEERERLRQIASELRPAGMGLIVRTVAEKQDHEAFRQDLNFLLSLWERIQARYDRQSAPSLVYQDLDLVYRIIRDLFTEQINELLVDKRYEYDKIMEALDILGPALKGRVKLYHGELPIFDAYGVEAEIEKALSRIVWLNCGGYLVFDYTEALTVIDVNTGKYIGKTNLADTVLKTNKEAAAEISRQVRLRDIGGIIIIDFIDMESEEHRKQVLEVLTEKAKEDRTKSHILGLTALGLVEITRKKARQGLDAVLQQTCFYCGGRGKVLTADVVSARTERQLKDFLAGLDAEAVLLEAHQSVAGLLIGPGGSCLRKLEEETGKAIFIRGSETIHVEKYRILATGMLADVQAAAFPVEVGGHYEIKVEEPHANNPYDGISRISGLVIDVQGGGAYVGEKVTVQIMEVARTFARAKIV